MSMKAALTQVQTFLALYQNCVSFCILENNGTQCFLFKYVLSCCNFVKAEYQEPDSSAHLRNTNVLFVHVILRRKENMTTDLDKVVLRSTHLDSEIG